MSDNKNNLEITQPEPIEKKIGQGKPGPGRPRGTSNKISGVSILASIQKKCGRQYADQLAENYYNCILANDLPMIQKYDHMILNKVVGDLTNVDITSAGRQMGVQLIIQPAETGDTYE